MRGLIDGVLAKRGVAEAMQRQPHFSMTYARSRFAYIKGSAQSSIFMDGLQRAGVRKLRWAR